MARKSGVAKTGGRKKGSQDMVNQLGGVDTIRVLVNVMEDPERLAKELSYLHGKDYFKVYCDLQSFLRPKYQNIEFKGEHHIHNDVVDFLKTCIE